MWGLFKRKKPESEFLALLKFDADKYALAVEQFFTQMDSATRAHVLVAYENLLPVVSVMYSEAIKNGDVFTLDNFIPEAVKMLEASHGHEINSRRWAWFLFAAMLGRLERLSKTNAGALMAGAKVWCLLAEDAHFLKHLLPSNIVWKSDEKDWFDLDQSDQRMLEWTINIAMPPIFAEHETIHEFAQTHDFFLSPFKNRIGFMP
ncbi:hypothetical protein MOV61_17810 [Neorhizobium sp. BETTINA12A]|uniref:hypothetical protein n=1 Tax=Neorhizobium sp. BETTINA12A TaxID=2908924 RepID=UPI001FF1F78D|nr:hypothetical protein [Neorhizobium sp. BETTINA12A]MCJ9752578.1 hypothetical protein [Neorhizobium sp. BETTINA12A]